MSTCKLMSKYLKTEFEIETYADENETKQIISHDSLEDIIHNRIASEYGLKYKMIPISLSTSHCVFCCSIEDDKGRHIEAIGESLPQTLETEIAKNYPALIASQRGFDRAAIRYLDFPGKTLSNMELALDSASKQFVPQQPQPVASQYSPHQQAPKRPVQQPALHPAQQIVQQQQQNQMPQQYQQPNTSSYGDTIINIGQYRTAPQTIANIYKTNPSYIKWICENYPGRSDDDAKIKAACAAFLKQLVV